MEIQDGWGKMIGCKLNMVYACDGCGQQEDWRDDDAIISIHRDDDGADYCQSCMRERYAVNDIILAFFPEMAEFINERGSLAAAARSLDLEFDQLQGLVVIQAWDDFQSTLKPDNGATVRLAAFSGTMNRKNAEIIVFKVHLGSADLRADDLIQSRDLGYAIRFDPQNIVDHLQFNSRTTWINMKSWTDRTNYPIEYRYNVFDNAGLDLVFEWARAVAVNWIICIDPIFPEYRFRK